MPPRFAFWTILLGGQPTAFRARTREELLPTLGQLRSTTPDAVMKWFARGRLWESPEEAHLAAMEQRRTRESRGADWRPGGRHEDPRARFRNKGPAPDRPGARRADGAEGRPPHPDDSRPDGRAARRQPQSRSRFGGPRKPGARPPRESDGKRPGERPPAPWAQRDQQPASGHSGKPPAKPPGRWKPRTGPRTGWSKPGAGPRTSGRKR
jgi:hypothetical protein